MISPVNSFPNMKKQPMLCTGCFFMSISEFLVELIGYILFKAQLFLAPVEDARDGREVLYEGQPARYDNEL